jgi:putative ABC transport system permease protein
MRSIRKLRPTQKDDFAMNELSIIANGFNGIFSMLNIIGWVIGFFALIVGGFGIANIMYVSVTERTNIIGVKKALGARRNYILMEFLIESILLCLFGGFLGLAVIALITGPLSTCYWNDL